MKQKDVAISVRQFTIFVSFYIIGSSIILIPSLLTIQAKQDAWMSALLAMAIAVMLIYGYRKLIEMFPDKTIIEMNEAVFGKWIGKAVSLLYVTYFVFLTALVTRTLGDFMVTQILVQTPMEVIHLLFLLVRVMGVRLGLEVLARTAEIFFPAVLLFCLLVLLFLLPNYEIENFQPVFENGILSIWKGTWTFLGIPIFDLIVLLMITPYVRKEERSRLRKGFFIGTIGGCAVVSLFLVLCLAVLGVDFTARNTYPTYILGKRIAIGHFLERIEGMVAILWVMTIFFKMTICYFASVLALAQIFRLRDYKCLILPLCYTIMVYSIISIPNMAYFRMIALRYWTFYVAIFGVVFPFLLFFVAKFRQLSAKKEQ